MPGCSPAGPDNVAARHQPAPQHPAHQLLPREAYLELGEGQIGWGLVGLAESIWCQVLHYILDDVGNME
ncbi:hypothetical protein LCGC14_1950150, partial [marine sediment metagenome]